MTLAAPSRRDRALAIAAVVAAMVPIFVALGRALANDWMPLNDNGLTAIRTLDVFGADTPLTGLASSASLVAPRPFNHPGPLQFQLLAAPVWLFGVGAGLAIGTAAVNAGAVALIGWVGWRRDGVPGAVGASLIAAVLVWSMGSELLYDPWQPHATLLPLLALLFLSWSVACGDFVLIPVAVAVATLVVQTHVTSLFLAPTVLGIALVLGVTTTAAGWRRVRRPALIAAGVGAVLWSAPLVEEFGAGRGNLSRLVDAARQPSDQVVGAIGALRLEAAIVALPPAWVPHSFRDTLRVGPSLATTARDVNGLDLPGARIAILAVTILVTLLGVLAVVGWRRGAISHTAGAVVALGALAAGWYTAAQVTTEIVGVAAHQFRFFWPIGAFVTFVLARAAIRCLVGLGARTPDPRPVAARPRVAAMVTSVALAGVMVAAIPAQPAAGGPQLSLAQLPIARDLAAQLGPAERSPQPIELEWSGLVFQEPYSSALSGELVRRGVDVSTDAEFLLRQVGEHRRDDGRATEKIFYRSGSPATSRRLGPFRRVAFHAGLSAGERRELRRLSRDIEAELVGRGLPVTRGLREARAAGFFRQIGPPWSAARVDRIVADGSLADAWADGLIDVPASARARFSRYAALRRRFGRDTIGVFIGPVDAPAPPR